MSSVRDVTTGKFTCKYTDDQIAYLATLSDLSYAEITKKFNEKYFTNISVKGIATCYQKYIGIKQSCKYSPKMVAWLHHNYMDFDTCKNLVKAFNETFQVNYTYNSIKAKCNDAGLKFTNHHQYTADQIKFLRYYCYVKCKNNFKCKNISDLAKKFNNAFGVIISESSIRNQLNRLSYTTKRFKFQEVHIKWLQTYASKYTITDLHDRFNELFQSDISRNTLSRCLDRYSIPHKNGKYGGRYSRMPQDQITYLLNLSPSLSFANCTYLINKKFHVNKTTSAVKNFYTYHKIKRYRGELTSEQKQFIEKYVAIYTYNELLHMMKSLWSNVTRNKIIRYAQTLYLNPSRHRYCTAVPIGTIRTYNKPFGNAMYIKREIKTSNGWTDYDRYKYDVSENDVILRKDPSKFIESKDDFVVVPKFMLLELKKHGIEANDSDSIATHVMLGILSQILKQHGK